MELHAAARNSGQFYPPDPTRHSPRSAARFPATHSGSRSFKFGATRRWIERLRIVLMNGQVLDVKRGDKIDFQRARNPQPRARKHSAGYPLKPGMDWIDLFAGSEGTLGIVVEATLKLLPAPKSILGGIVFFASEDEALDALAAWRSVDGLRMLEYIDGDALDMKPHQVSGDSTVARGAPSSSRAMSPTKISTPGTSA